ncbi:MAG: OmpA family protein [Candidatus Ratteibacteria bacterium]
MMRKLAGIAALLAVVFLVGGCGMSTIEGQKDFSWYGKSGAVPAPYFDGQGEWWMPNCGNCEENVAKGDNWGNRGYVYVASPAPAKVAPVPEVVVKETPKPEVIEKIVEKPVEKIVYRDRIVEKPVEKIVYRDRVVEKPVEKIVYRDKVVESVKVRQSYLDLKDVFFAFDSAALTQLAKATLKENATILRENPNISIILEGSASPEGGSEYNLKLSERRIKSVLDHLLKVETLPASRFQQKPKGKIDVEKPSYPFARKVHFAVVE